MRIIILLLFIFTTIPTVSQQPMARLSWLAGTWEREMATPSSAGAAFEIWTLEGNQFIGLGVTLRGADTVFVEKLKIISEGSDLFYVADIAENPQPVRFRFTELTESGFTCENPAHDFPKKIAYQLNGTYLKATVSGDGRAMDFLFEKRD